MRKLKKGDKLVSDFFSDLIVIEAEKKGKVKVKCQCGCNATIPAIIGELIKDGFTLEK